MGLGKYFKASVLIVFLYIFIYNPPVKGLPNLIWLTLPLAYLYLINYSLIGKLIYLLKNEIIVLLLLGLYTIFRDFDWNSGTFAKTFIYGNVSLIFEVIPYSLFLVDMCYRKMSLPKNIANDKKLINIILVTCFIAALITFLLLINPAFAVKMNNSILISSESQQNNILRGFGFASLLTYSFGIVQGIIAAIILLKMTENQQYLLVYIFIFILLLVSILVNARIGMAPVLIMIFYLIFIKKKIKVFLYGSGIMGAAVIIFLSSSFAAKYQKMIEWGTSFFTQTFGFVSGSKSGQSNNTYDILLNKMVILPETFMDWMVGTGNDLVLGSQNNPVFENVGHSDIGFVRQLYFGGLIYVGLILLLIAIMAIRIYRLKNYNWFLILFLLTVISANIKGYFVANQPAFRLLIVLYVGFIYYSFQTQTNKKLVNQEV